MPLEHDDEPESERGNLSLEEISLKAS